jgi:hypothetical protein
LLTREAVVNPRFYVYQYHFIDDLEFVHPIDDRIPDEWVETIKGLFLKAGWEGDGEFGVIWLPPFVGEGLEHSVGTPVLHVKQENNGTSWLASTYPLNFGPLREQNESPPHTRGTPVNILHSDIELFEAAIAAIIDPLRKHISHLRATAEKKAAAEIEAQLLEHAQGMLVAALQEFFDDCFLKVLIQVIDRGNRYKLTVPKITAKLETKRYVPEELDDEDNWFTLKGVTRDAWRGYRFLSFPQKQEYLFKSFGFTEEEKRLALIRKHVAIRNAIQHDGGVIGPWMLEDLGVTSLRIMTDEGGLSLGARDRIVLALAELQCFVDSLRGMVERLSSHVDERVPERDWIPCRTSVREAYEQE